MCRELTKVHEEIWPATIGEARARYADEAPRGEFVLVMEGAPEQQAQPCTLDDAAALARRYAEEGMAPSAAAKRAAAETPFSRSEIYRAMLGEA